VAEGNGAWTVQQVQHFQAACQMSLHFCAWLDVPLADLVIHCWATRSAVCCCRLLPQKMARQPPLRLLLPLLQLSSAPWPRQRHTHQQLLLAQPRCRPCCQPAAPSPFEVDQKLTIAAAAEEDKPEADTTISAVIAPTAAAAAAAAGGGIASAVVLLVVMVLQSTAVMTAAVQLQISQLHLPQQHCSWCHSRVCSQGCRW